MATETRPRGPIAAMYGSPGPCYALPGLTGKVRHPHDPRSVHNRAPAYCFGQRHGKWRDDCGPGPVYNPNARFTRYGHDGSPHFSLYRRPVDLKLHKTPGPGAYSPEKSGATAYYHHPSYTLGGRFKQRGSDSTPAPNAYSLPPMMSAPAESRKRRAPCYSLRGRSKIGGFHEDLQKTPGPGAYQTTDPNITKRRLPASSMTSRNPMPGDSTQKPGPGAHSPEKFYYKAKPAAPQFSFGIRHSQYEAPLIVEVAE